MGVVRAASTPTGVSTRAQLSILGGEGVRDPQKVPGCAGFWLQPGTASAACIPLPRHPKPQKFPKLPSPEVAPGGQTASGTVRKSFATFQDWPPEVGLFSWEKGCPRPFLVGGRGEGVSGVTEREREGEENSAWTVGSASAPRDPKITPPKVSPPGAWKNPALSQAPLNSGVHVPSPPSQGLAAEKWGRACDSAS